MAIKQNNGNILHTVNVLKHVMDASKDGEEFINISLTGKTELGRFFSLTDCQHFHTFLGRTNSIGGFIDAITNPSFDLSLLSKKFITREDAAAYVKAPKVTVTNYWSLVAYAVCCKVDKYKHIQELMKKNNLLYTSIGKPKETDLFNQYTIKINSIRTDMVNFVAIVQLIEQMVKEDRFTKENIEKFCLDLRRDPTKDLLDGIACANLLVKVEPTRQNTEEA